MVLALILRTAVNCHQTHPDVECLQAALFSVCHSRVGKSLLCFQSGMKVSSHMKEQLLHCPSFPLSPDTATKLGGRDVFFHSETGKLAINFCRGARWSLLILRHPLTSISLATCGRLCGVFPVLWQTWF